MLNYEHDAAGQFQLPDDATCVDVAPDGRLLAAGVDTLWRESQPGSRSFQAVSAPAFGSPALIRVSPSGDLIAVGSYGSGTVRIFDLATAGQTTDVSIDVSPYDAEWFSERYLAVTGQGADGSSPPSTVHVIDADNAKAAVVISDIPGHSGGVTFDVDGNLYTGIGLASDGGSSTGLIKAFKRDAWQAAMAGNSLDFNSNGKKCVDLLSAAFLSFDGDNNLCVAGGAGIDSNGDPDMGYVAVVSHHGLRGSLYDQPVVEPDADSQILQKLDPTANNETYWLSNSNPVQREIYLFEFASRDVYVFRPRLTRELIETHFQLGDNPGYYKGTRFVGMKLQMPLLLPDPAEVDGGVTIRLGTQYVETLNTSRHVVSLNGTKIGEMTGGYFVEERETFDFFVERTAFETIYNSANPATLGVDVDDTPGQGLADDFVLRYAGAVFRPT